ncbi:MAG: RNA polymerase sigma factor [Gemmatimonadales bacterium]
MRTTRSVATLVRTARNARAPLERQHDAFTTLVRRFEGAALAVAVSLTGEVDLARDVCQDAFLDAWRKLGSLREPAAFGGWLLRLVRTHAMRRHRRRGESSEGSADALAGVADRSEAANPAEALDHAELQRVVWRAVQELPVAQRETVVMFYFLGEPMRAIASAMRVPAGTVGKRLHAARIALRRRLPRAVAATFLATAPTAGFARRVRAGIFAELEGEYRFAARPTRPVIIRREGDVLVSHAAGRRNVLASNESDVLRATEFDGEARFQRDRRGRITHFVYYEFGKRLGVARRVGVPSPRAVGSPIGGEPRSPVRALER